MHILIADFGSCKILHNNDNSTFTSSAVSSPPRGSADHVQSQQQMQQQQQQQQRQRRASISPVRCVPNPPSSIGTAGNESRTRRKSSSGSYDGRPSMAVTAVVAHSSASSSSSTSSSPPSVVPPPAYSSSSYHQRGLRPRVASFVGTPHYVSPEMLKGFHNLIFTRFCVYSFICSFLIDSGSAIKPLQILSSTRLSRGEGVRLVGLGLHFVPLFDGRFPISRGHSTSRFPKDSSFRLSFPERIRSFGPRSRKEAHRSRSRRQAGQVCLIA